MDISKERIKEIIREEYERCTSTRVNEHVGAHLDDEKFRERENDILTAVRQLIKDNATPDQMGRLLKSISDSVKSRMDWRQQG